MSTLKILLPGGKVLRVGSPFTKESNSLGGVSLVINFISLSLITLFAFLLPFSGHLFGNDTETSTLKFLLTFVLAFLFVFILKLLVQGTSFVIDPKGLLLILVFNLVLTIISVTITALRVSNTFGTTGFRFLSGLALMSLIGFFYFANLYFLNKSAVKRFFDLLVVSSVLYVVWYLLAGTESVSVLLTYLPLITISFALLAYRITTEYSRKIGTFILFTFGLLVLIAVPFTDNTYSNLFYFVITLFIAYFMVLGLYALNSRSYIKNRLKEIKNNIQNFIKVKHVSIPTEKGIADLHFLVMLLIPILLIISALFFFISSPTSEKNNLIVEIANGYGTAFKMITGGTNAVSGDNLRAVLLGMGSDNYNPSVAFLANVLIVQGVVGLTIYLLLWGYFINLAKTVFQKSLKSRQNYKLAGIALFTTIFIPLNLVTTYGSLISVVLLWVFYAIVTSMNATELNYLDNSVKLQKQTAIKLVIRAVIAVITFAALAFTLSFITGALK